MVTQPPDQLDFNTPESLCLMQHSSSLLESAVAPSPAIPTCRHSQPSSRRRPASTTPDMSAEEMHGASSGRRPAPRSAGASNRPMKNENILELVRFFQTQEAPLQGRYDGALDMLKAGPRRLRQLAQAKGDKRPKREGAATPTEERTDKTYRQLVALQRAGFLPNISMPADRHSLDIARSRSKRDVEAIGQPWLEDSGKGKKTQEDRRKRASMDIAIGDLSPLVEFSVSFSDLEGLTPPPYQQTESGKDDHRNETAETPAGLSDSAAAGDRLARYPDGGEVGGRRADSVPATAHHGAPSAPCPEKTVVKLQHDSGGPDGHDAGILADEKQGKLQKQVQDAAAGAILRPESSSNPSSPGPLNVRASRALLPEYLPPRVSSRSACSSSSSSSTSSRQPGRILSTSPQPVPVSLPVKALEADGKLVSDAAVSITIDRFPRPHGSTSPGPMKSMTAGGPLRASSATPDPFASASTRASLQGPIDALPPPAPTKPLPSLPEQAAAADSAGPHRSTVSKRRVRPSSTSYPDAVLNYSEDASVRNGPSPGAAYSPRHRRVLVPRSPRPSARLRSYTTEQMSTQDGESVDTGDSSQMSTLERMRRNREERVRALRMRDITATRPHSKDEKKQNAEEPKQWEESPVLGQSDFSRQSETAPNRPDTSLQSNNANKEPLPPKSPLPENPNPPPSFPLPADPPVSRVNRSSSQRRTGSTASLPPSAITNGESSATPGSPRSTRTFQTNSVRSNSVRRRRESRDHAANQDDFKSPRHSESPSLPSSDDEGYGTRVHSARSGEEHNTSRKTNGAPRPHSIVVTDGTDAGSHGRKSLPFEYIAPLTPRFRGPYSQEHSSPRSQYSQRTTNSHESRASQQHNPLHPLEARVALLERQNKMLQAALLAALDMGVTFDADSVRSGVPTPVLSPTGLTSPTVSTGFPPVPGLSGLGLDDMQYGQERAARKRTPAPRPDSWMSARDRDRRSSFGTAASDDSSASVKELEAMLGDFDLARPSDQQNVGHKTQ